MSPTNMVRRRSGLYVPVGGGGSPTYNSVVEALSPLIRLKLDDSSGTSAAALHGSAGTYAGTPTLAAAALVTDGGTAVTMDGNTQEVSVPVTTGAGVYKSVLFTFLTSDTDSSVLWRDHSSGAGSGSFLQIGTGTNTPVARINGSNHSISPAFNSNNIRNGVKHQLLITNDGSTMVVHLDGVQLDSWAPGGTWNFATPLHFGRNGSATGTANFYAVKYDDISLFAAALTTTDRDAIWAVT